LHHSGMRADQKQRASEFSNTAADSLPKAFGRQVLPIALLVLVGALVYLNSLSNGFVYDDYAVIVENKYIHNPNTDFLSFFNRSYFKIAGGEASYRPVATLSYFLIHRAAGMNPFYYHLTSVALHILNILLVYWTARLILKDPVPALIAGLLFACHPAQTETVDCVAYNEDLLTASFFLLAFIMYLKATPADLNKTKVQYYSGSLLCFLLGLLSKEMAITLPAVLLLYDLTLRAGERHSFSLKMILKAVKDRVRLYAGYAAVGLFYLALRFVFLSNPAAQAAPSYRSLLARILYLPAHIFSFIKLALFPVDLNADYVFSYPPGFFDISNLAGFTIVVGLAAASFYIYKHSRKVFFCMWWFPITLFPVYNIIPIFNPFAERYLYIPLIGFCMLAALIFNDLFFRRFAQTAALKVLTLAALFAVVGFYATVTAARNRDWKDNYTLWAKTVKQSPASSVAHGSLGRAYQEQGRLDKAVGEYEKALRIFPADYKAHYNLGVIYDKQNLLAKAVHHYQMAIEISPQFVDARFNLANIYQKQGLLDKAIQQYRKLTEVDPEDFEARNNLGVVYAMQGDLEKAISEWGKVLDIDPANQSAQDNIRKAKAILQKSE
jgi:tetratricopeptide (TPR) repeat protein